MAIIDVVRFNGLKSRDWLIYKYPSESIPYGSQLIVQEGQAAFFVKGGVIADEFLPGTYTLRSDNLPILSGIVKIPFGGDTPFSAEVYFVNTSIKLDVNWGTVDPIQIVDPKYYVRLHVRAFGQMGVCIADNRQVFTKIIGSMQRSEIVKFESVSDFFKGIIVLKVKAALSDVIITNKISALEISAKQEAISQTVGEGIRPGIEEFGFRLVNFYIQSINFPDEDFANINKILEDKAAFEIMGDSRYATKRSFDVYEGAANNNGTAGSIVSGGVGLGAALQMGRGFIGNASHGSGGNQLTNPEPLNSGMAAEKMNFNSQQTMSNPYANQTASPTQTTPVMGSQYTKQCINCKSYIGIESKFCPECGFDNQQSRHCSCGYELKQNMKFCPQCGKAVISES